MRVAVASSAPSTHQPGLVRVKLACGHRMVVHPYYIEGGSAWCHACALGSGKPNVLNGFAKQATEEKLERPTPPDPPAKKKRKKKAKEEPNF